MLATLLIPAFMLGLVSSAHCIGMCGPLALALPLHHLQTRSEKVLGVFLYNTGRICSYLFIGLLFAWLGRNLLVPQLQKGIAITGGVLLISIALLTAGKRTVIRLPYLNILFKPVYQLVNYSLKQKSLPGVFITGVANGLLPCGLVYMAAGGAFMWGDIGKGLLFMACYGLGTTPAMALLSLMGFAISLPTRKFIRHLAPCIAILTGTLLLLRGLDLNIPFIAAWPIPGVQHGGVSCSPLK